MSIQRILNNEKKIDLQYLQPPQADDPIKTPIEGVTDASFAQAGQVGQILQNWVNGTPPVAVNVDSTEPELIGSLTVTAGRWLVFANCFANANTGNPFNGDLVFFIGIEGEAEPRCIIQYGSNVNSMQINIVGKQAQPFILTTDINRIITVDMQTTSGAPALTPSGFGAILAYRLA